MTSYAPEAWTSLQGTTSSPSSDPEFWVGYRQIIRCLCMTITAVLCIIFNTLNLVVLKNAPHSFGETTSLILSTMAITDICAGVSYIVIDNIENFTDLPKTFPLFCSITFPWKGFVASYSLSLLGVLNLDRIILVTRPLRYYLIVTRHRIIGAIILAAIPPLGIAINSTTTRFRPINRYCVITTSDEESSLDLIASLVALFIVAEIFFITYANVHLLVTACRHGAKMRATVAPGTSMTGHSGGGTTVRESNAAAGQENLGAPSNGGDLGQQGGRIKTRKPLDLKGLRTVLTVTVALYIAAAPYVTHLVLGITDDDYFVRPWVEFLGFFMILTNSWWNPVIYLLLNKSYRHTMKRMLQGH